MAADTEVVAGHRLQFRVLGPVEVLHEGETLDLGVYKQRALLSLLLINANDVVSTDRIIDDLWGKSAGKDRQNALWVVVSRLRSLLDPDRPRRSDGTVLLTRAPGYMLVVPDDDLDSVRFERLAREGRSLLEADPARASVVLGEAAVRWRSSPTRNSLLQRSRDSTNSASPLSKTA